MYSRNIDNDIDEMINNYNACQKYQNFISREPLLSHEITK